MSDTRESPALQITQRLADENLRILVADPKLQELPSQLAGRSNVTFVETGEAVRRADILAILVAHSAFRRIPREEVLQRIVIDATGLFQRPDVRNA